MERKLAEAVGNLDAVCERVDELETKLDAAEDKLDAAGDLVGELLETLETADPDDFDGFSLAEEWRDHLGKVLVIPDGHYEPGAIW